MKVTISRPKEKMQKTTGIDKKKKESPAPSPTVKTVKKTVLTDNKKPVKKASK